jgi:hypothetical protein
MNFTKIDLEKKNSLWKYELDRTEYDILILHCVVSQNLTDVSEVLTAIIWTMCKPHARKRLSIGPAKFRPDPACSCSTNCFPACGLLVALIMEAVNISETSVNFNKTIWGNIQED